MRELKVIGFNYACLKDPDQGKTARQQAEAIRQLTQRTAMNIIEIGRRLKEVHELVGRSYFKAWVKAEFNWGFVYAYGFIRIAERFGQVDCLGRFDLTGLMLLSAPSTPQQAVTEAIERAKAGEPISMKRAFEIRHKYDPSKPAAQPRTKNVITDLREFVLSMATRLGHRFVIQQLQDLLTELQETGKPSTSPSEPRTQRSGVSGRELQGTGKRSTTPAPRANGRRLAAAGASV